MVLDCSVKKIVFLEPTARVLGLSTYAAHNILEPLGLEYLATYLEGLGHSCSVIQQRCESQETVLMKIIGEAPNVLGISTQAYNIKDALWFAEKAKAAIPNLTVVLGGYHASAVPDLVAHPAVDYVIIGEGEVAMAELLATLGNGKLPSNVPGVAYFDGEVRVNPCAKRIEKLDELVFPKRSPEILRQCHMHGLMYPPPSQQTNIGMVTATRGCPYNCAFCCSQLIWNYRMQKRSPCNVADELEWLVEKYDVNGVFFCDLTFNADKKYTIALCSEIAKRDLPLHFYAMCHLRGMDKEIADAMASAKCSKIGFGVESFTEAVRFNMKALGGMDLDSVNHVFDEILSAGVLIKAYFIIGFPWETRESLERLQEDITNLNADEIKVTFYVPFPGTKGYELHKEYLMTTDWSKFTTLTEPIVRNDNVSTEEFKQMRRSIFSKFYNSPKWRSQVLTRLAKFPRYAGAFSEFVTFLKEQNILDSEIEFFRSSEIETK